MSDGLENFIRKNRKEFDDFEPLDTIWNDIESGLDGQQKLIDARILRKQLNFVFKIAAVLAVIVISGISFLAYQKTKPINVSLINPELAKQQVHYTTLIESRLTELEEVKSKEPKLYNEFTIELQKLDRTYQKITNRLGFKS